MTEQVDAFPDARLDPVIDPDKRYTTRETMTVCMRLAGVDAWDLDVAADDESFWAPRWYSAAQDGLSRPWDAARVWCNPPYSDIEPWVKRAWEAIARQEASIIAMLLPNNRTDQGWFQRYVEPFRDNRPARPILVQPPEHEADLRLFINENSAQGTDGCWLWQRYRQPKGYGRIRWKGTMQLAHRLAFRAWFYEPGTLLVCHRCDVPECVNPSHLFVGTDTDNMRDRNAKGRTARGEKAARSLPKSRVELIRWLSSCGVKQCAIVRETGISSSTVSRILSGKRWSVEPSQDASPGVKMETHYLPGRLKFGHPGNRNAIGVGSPPFGCVLLVWRGAE